MVFREEARCLTESTEGSDSPVCTAVTAAAPLVTLLVIPVSHPC